MPETNQVFTYAIGNVTEFDFYSGFALLQCMTRCNSHAISVCPSSSVFCPEEWRSRFCDFYRTALYATRLSYEHLSVRLSNAWICDKTKAPSEKSSVMTNRLHFRYIKSVYFLAMYCLWRYSQRLPRMSALWRGACATPVKKHKIWPICHEHSETVKPGTHYPWPVNTGHGHTTRVHGPSVQATMNMNREDGPCLSPVLS